MVSPKVAIDAEVTTPCSSSDAARLGHAARPARRRRLVRGGRVLDPQRDGADAVAMEAEMIGDVALGLQRRGEHQANLALLEDVAGPVANAGLGAGIGDDVETEGLAVVVRGLARVADPQLHVVGALEHRHGYLGDLNHVVLL